MIEMTFSAAVRLALAIAAAITAAILALVFLVGLVRFMSYDEGLKAGHSLGVIEGKQQGRHEGFFDGVIFERRFRRALLAEDTK
jgi:hypothetical protein